MVRPTQVFYFNTQTGETSRELPELEGSDDDGQGDLTTLGTSTTFADSASRPESKGSGNRSFSSTTAEVNAVSSAGDFALLSEVNNQLPPHWTAKLSDEGIVQYRHDQTGQVQTYRPSPKDSPESDRRTPFFSSTSSSPAPRTLDISRSVDQHDDNSDLDPEPYRARASTSTQSMTTGGMRDDTRRKLKELEDSLASSEIDGIPVLALKVRTAAKSLKSTFGQFVEVARLDEERFDEVDRAIQTELGSVLAAARSLVHASGVLGTVGPSNGGGPGAVHPSESLRTSHLKVQKAVANLIGSVELFRHASEADADDELKVVSAAEDMERTVVAFGLEAERGRVLLTVGSPTERRPKRLEAWLDSAGVALPLGGRSGFSAELDRDVITRPFGLDAEDEVLQDLQQGAFQQIDQYLEELERLQAGDAGHHGPSEVLIHSLQAILHHVRSFDIAVAIDLDGEEPHPTSNPNYAKLVGSANEILRQYELALDAYTCALGDLTCSLGSPEEERPILVSLRKHLASSTSAFLALNTVSLAQAQAVRGGVRGRIGARKPQSSMATDRSTSRMSLNSIRSKTSVGSRRSHLLSLRSGRSTARGLDEEVDDDKPTEDDDETRDMFSYESFTSSAPTSTVSLTGRARQGSISAMSTVSSNSSVLPWESGYGTDNRMSGSSKSNLEMLGALRGRRESIDSSTHPPYRLCLSEHPADSCSSLTLAVTLDVGKTVGKASKVLGVNNVVLPPADTPWYLEGDVNADEIVMVEGKTEGAERDVKGGSIGALVTRLTQHRSEYSAHSFRESFLMTFKCFTNSEELIELLESRFYIEPPSGLTDEEMKRWEMEKRMPIRLKFVLPCYVLSLVRTDEYLARLLQQGHQHSQALADGELRRVRAQRPATRPGLRSALAGRR